jgi:hypothetical protein
VKDTAPRVASCNRCGQIVLTATASGFRAAVDPTPLTWTQMTLQLRAGGSLYRIYIQAGRPTRLEYVSVALLRSPAARYGTYAAAHGCGCHAMDARVFEEPPDPSQAPVAVPSGLQGLSATRDATQRRSRPGEGLSAARCHNCGQIIEKGDINRIQLEWPVWQEVHHHVPNRGTRLGYDKIYKGWGCERWQIHSDGCPPTSTEKRDRDGGR